MKSAFYLFFLLQTSLLYSMNQLGIVSVPVADLRTTSNSIASSLEYDANQESQLLYGERVKIKLENGDWIKIEAMEQQEFSHNSRWEGYPGWIKKNSIAPVKSFPHANWVVTRKTTKLYSSPDGKNPIMLLSMGTKLTGLGTVANHFRKIKTLDGEAWIHGFDIRSLKSRPQESHVRKIIIESALELLGDPYFWGGLSAHISDLKNQITAVDCSGLVHLSYRVAGIDIPRDSYEQYMKSKKIPREKLKMGDLVFSAPQDKPDKISHVAIFMDEQYLIEAPKSGESVRKIEFEKKYGVPLAQVQSGQSVEGRVLYFGTYLH